MVTRNSRYAWMTLGGLLCLFGLAMACKLRDGNRAMARSAPLVPVAGETSEPPRAMPSIGTALPDLVPPAPTTDFGTIQQIVPTLVPLREGTPTVIQAAAVMPNTPTPTPVPESAGQPILIPAGGGVSPPAPPGITQAVPLPRPDITDLTPPAAPVIPAPAPVSPPAPVTPPPSAPVAHPAPNVPGEPPLAPNPGPVMMYKVTRVGETFKTLARKMLGTAERWSDIHKLNPTLPADVTIITGATVRLPADACITEEGEALRALPTLRPRTIPKARAVLPLTGTFSLTLDDAKGLTLPRAIQQQFGMCDTVLVSPGSDRCLWITNQAHLDRLQAKLDKSPARESDVRGFKRLYYAQTVKCPVKEGRVQITEKLAQFADLGAEVVLVGIDDHFEVWDAARWKKYTQTKKAISTEE